MSAVAAPPETRPRFDPVFGAQATFRIVLDAMARPGTVLQLPAADPAVPLPAARFAAAVLQTLLDHEVGFAVAAAPDDEPERDRITTFVAESTGSRPLPLETADYVLALGPLPPGLPATLKRGTPAYPDEGATLICLVPPFLAAEAGTPVTLTGPGVPDRRALRLPGLTPADLSSLAAANADPPLGIDLILIDPGGHLTCLPRSTRWRQ